MSRRATSDPSAVWLPREPAVVGRLVATGAASGAAVEGAAVALALAVYAMTHSTAWVSGVLLASLGLSALLSPLGGVVADRYPRRRVMLLSAACQVPIYVLVAVAGEPWQLVALAGVAAATQRPFDASLAASIPALVPEQRRIKATSSVAAAQQTATLLSPAAAGAAMAVAGQRWTFLGVAVLYAAVVATVSGLPARPAAVRGPQGVGSSLREGRKAAPIGIE